MSYHDLVQLYFDRSNALQWYWTIYVIVIGGLLAFSSIRRQSDFFSTALVTILFCCFSYKNLDAIRDVSEQRSAILQTIRAHETGAADATDIKPLRVALEPTLVAPEFPGVRNFHIASAALTAAAVWGMELRRRKAKPTIPA